MKVHKTMTLKERKKLGYEGYLARSWKKVNCKKCLEKSNEA